jgi:ubiquitin carboxyl-terminal hydrolase calypso
MPRSNSNVQRANSDSFHFVSYLPINNRLYELDGLKKYPVDHGPIEDNEDWSEKFRRVITQRLTQETQCNRFSDGQSSKHDIRYNLMAVVPDRRVTYLNKLNILKTNRHIVLEALERIMRPTRLPEPFDYHNYSKYPTSIEYQDPPNIDDETIDNNQPINEPLSIDTKTSNSSISVPLTIATSNISPMSSSSTDTSSEVGSAFNSPTPGTSSNDIVNNFYVFKILDKDKKESPTLPKEIESKTTPASLTKSFGPRDLVALSKALNAEINICEHNLKDELEKRRRYRIDDSRRIHNYDEFINTFILMLAEQKKLPTLLEKALFGSADSESSEQTNHVKDHSYSAFLNEILNSFEEISKKGKLRSMNRPGRPEKRKIANHNFRLRGEAKSKIHQS